MADMTNTSAPQGTMAQTQEQVKSSAKTANKAAARTVEAAAAMTPSGLDVAVPEAFRSMAEKAVTQSREAYEQAKSTMEEAVETLEKSLDKAGQGAAAINRKVIDITQANVNSGFALAKDLAGAKNFAEIVELQTAFARKQFEALLAQAEEMRALSTKVAAESGEPFKAHISRSMQVLRQAS